MGGITTDREMKDFRSELEEIGPTRIARKLDQGVYAKGDWKYKAAKRFLEEASEKETRKLTQEELNLAKESNEISRHANKIAYWALGISAFAILVSLLTIFFK